MSTDELINGLENMYCTDCKYYNSNFGICESYRNCDKVRLEVIDRLYKYRWHDLRKNSDDLPNEPGNYLVYAPMYEQVSADEVDVTPKYSVQPYLEFSNGMHWLGDIVDDEVWCWKYIEEIEE